LNGWLVSIFESDPSFQTILPGIIMEIRVIGAEWETCIGLRASLLSNRHAQNSSNSSFLFNEKIFALKLIMDIEPDLSLGGITGFP
jgi:hypothetical protein